MKKILVFAGTTEGRQLVEALALCCSKQDPHRCVKQPLIYVSVATEYGKSLLPANSPYVEVNAQRLLPEEMEGKMAEEGFDLVVDTTHPYALLVTRYIKQACDRTGTPYIRLLRAVEKLPFQPERTGEFPFSSKAPVVFVKDSREAVSYLNQTQGTVLLTTGSKELEIFTQVKDYEERLYPRVLPTAEVVEKCSELGYPGKHLICMQGPFSLAMNEALLDQIGAAYLVTKDSGTVGGFGEKALAAKKAGVQLVVIGRRPGEEGQSLEEVVTVLEQEWGFSGLGAQVCENRQGQTQGEDVEKKGKDAGMDGGTDGSSLRKIHGYFPLFVDIQGKEVLVVGAGKIGERRMETLCSFAAAVTVIAPRVSEKVQRLAQQGSLRWIKATIGEVGGTTDRQSVEDKDWWIIGDTQGEQGDRFARFLDREKPFLVLAATNERRVNHAIARMAKKRNIPVNAADCKEDCAFYFPGIVRQGPVVVGVTAGGKDHGLARKTTEAIAEYMEKRETDDE